MSEEQLVVFRLGKEQYGVPISQVREIIQYTGATKLPNSPDYLDGVINLRGKVIPVMALAKRIGLLHGEGNTGQVIITEWDHEEMGIVVDEVTEVLKLKEASIEAAPPMASGGKEYVRGIGRDNGRLLILLDLIALLLPQEQFSELG